jgi:hypothetical protein
MSALDVIAIRAPELSSYPGIEQLIALAGSMSGAFGDDVIEGTTFTRRDMAVALRTLHIIVRRESRDNSGGKGQTAGFITSETEGQVSVSTKVSEVDQKRYGDLVTTLWGQELIEMIKSTFFLPRTRMC